MSQQRYPYDEQNERDFEQTTSRIRDALERIRDDDTLDATGKSLAKLAGVSRKTLYNRKWPTEKLRSIKEERREAAAVAARRDKADADDTESREEKLERQVENFKTRNAFLFRELEDTREQIEDLEHENKCLQSVNRDLKSRLDRAKISHGSVQPNSNLSLVPNLESTGEEAT